MVSGLLLLGACSRPQDQRRVEAKYDETTGKLSQLTVDAAVDGKPNITSHMDGPKFVRIEIDANEDGKIDRWEYFGPDQKIVRVGVSRSDDGKEDAWIFPGPDGATSRIDVSTKQDGKANRSEFYERGVLIRAEEDTDADGRVDKWERYEGGALASVSFDTTRSGKPTATINYSK